MSAYINFDTIEAGYKKVTRKCRMQSDSAHLRYPRLYFVKSQIEPAEGIYLLRPDPVNTLGCPAVPLPCFGIDPFSHVSANRVTFEQMIAPLAFEPDLQTFFGFKNAHMDRRSPR